ncbi:hypothetical protein LINPERHAP2_LOCUS42922, partial [Linum perenne]
ETVKKKKKKRFILLIVKDLAFNVIKVKIRSYLILVINHSKTTEFCFGFGLNENQNATQMTKNRKADGLADMSGTERGGVGGYMVVLARLSFVFICVFWPVRPMINRERMMI